MSRINSSVEFNSLVCKLTSDNAMSIVANYDLVVDATDNIDARYTINDCCVLLRKPFISGSSVSMDGQITTVIPYSTPCYRCLYPKLSVSMGGCRSCADAGVLGPIPGLIGCLEAIEAIKLLLNRDKYITPTSSQPADVSKPATAAPAPAVVRTNGKSAAQMKPLLGRQVLYDAVSGEFHTFKLPPRNIHCAVCGDQPTITCMEDSKMSLQPVLCAVPPPQQPAATISDTEKTVSPPTTASVLSSANRISTTAFAEVLLNTNAAGNVSLIVDVRSAEQYSIAHLQDPAILSFTTLNECVEQLLQSQSPAQSSLEGVIWSDRVRAVQVSVPLSELLGGRVAAIRETNQSTVLDHLRNVRAFLTAQRGNTVSDSTVGSATDAIDDASGAGTLQSPIYVLCRRGIDSVTGTQILLDSTFGLQVFNVEGGLTAWSNQVDSNFVMY